MSQSPAVLLEFQVAVHGLANWYRWNSDVEDTLLHHEDATWQVSKLRAADQTGIGVGKATRGSTGENRGVGTTVGLCAQGFLHLLQATIERHRQAAATDDQDSQGTNGQAVPVVLNDDMSINVSLPFSIGLTGDFNDDGRVDAADYVIWRKFEGTTTALPNDNGIVGPVGTDHYNLWRANFGDSALGPAATLHAGSSAVPEPASALLAIWAAAWFACHSSPVITRQTRKVASGVHAQDGQRSPVQTDRCRSDSSRVSGGQ